MIRFDPVLQPGRLIRRYKRFLADIALPDGREVTAHCANPGAMTGLAEPGRAVWIQPVADPGRKLRWSWKLVEHHSGLVGIDTGLPNRLIGAALRDRMIPELLADEVRAEVRYGTNSRIDFLLDGATHVEVKNVHLMRVPGLAEFPDCVTARGTKHLRELADVARSGRRAVMVYCIQMTGAERFALAADIDPAYAAAFAAAEQAGVTALAYGCKITAKGIALGDRVEMSRGELFSA